jgi:hypothetical protein
LCDDLSDETGNCILLALSVVANPPPKAYDTNMHNTI